MMTVSKRASAKGKKRRNEYQEVGDFLRKRRTALRIGSMKLLAERVRKINPRQIDIDEKKISDWELGRHRPHVDVVQYLLKALEVRPGTPDHDTWERLYYQRPLEQRDEKITASRLNNHYLRWVDEQFQLLDLYGLHGSDRRSDIELEQVFVALRGGLGNPYQPRDEGPSLQELENWAELSAAPLSRSNAYGPDIESSLEVPIDVGERRLGRLFGPNVHESLSLGEAFRRERRLVILGDPGSGKTTLLRWIALMLAKTGLDHGFGMPVQVPHHCVDPYVDGEDASNLFDLGPARLPIYVRVASFLEHRARSGGALPFEAHLGQHMVPFANEVPQTVDGERLDPVALNALFLQAISDKRAVLLLDGLDEIADVSERLPVAKEIERFLDGIFFKDAASGAATQSGNQVIVTSRIVGYHMAGLGPRATHMTLEPMGQRAIERYCRLYTRERMRAMHGLDKLNDELSRKARIEADTIISDVLELRQRGSGDLAATPLLLTILIMVARPGGHLPDRRALLYREAAEQILATWRDRIRRTGNDSFPGPERLEAYLCQLAFTLQTASGLGLMERRDARSCLAGLGSPEEISAFIACASQEVGLLTARGADAIGFQHQTFQEYYSARWLVRKGAEITELIRQRVMAPRWREPILLALGLLSCEDSGRYAEDPLLSRILIELAETPAIDDNALPSEFLLACNALRELVWLPPKPVAALARRVIDARARVPSMVRLAVLDKQLRAAIGCLVEPRARPALAEALRRALTEAHSDPSDRALAAAALLPFVDEVDTMIVSALGDALGQDAREWGWPIDSALRLVASQDPTRALSERNSLRAILLRSPVLRERFLSAPSGRRLAWLLYGGSNANLLDHIDALNAQRIFRREAQRSLEAKERTAEVQLKIDELSAEIGAISDQIRELRLKGDQLAIERFHRDSAVVTPLVVRVLTENVDLISLVPELERAVADGLPESERVEVALALLAISPEPLDTYRRHIWKTEVEAATLSALNRTSYLLRLGVDASSQRAMKAACAAPEHQANRAIAQVVDAMLATYLKCGGAPFSPAEFLDVAPSFLRPHIMAEIWCHSLCSSIENPVYNLAVMLDTVGGPLSDISALAWALNYLPRARLGAQGASSWRPSPLMPRPRSAGQLVALALDVVVEFPQQFGFVAGWMLAKLAPALIEMGLRSDALLIVERQISETLGGKELAHAALVGDPDVAPSDAGWAIARLRARKRRFGDGENSEPLPMGSPPGRMPITFPLKRESEVRAALAALTSRVASAAPVDIHLGALESALATELDLDAPEWAQERADLLIASLRQIALSGDPDNAWRLLGRLAQRVPEPLAGAFIEAAAEQVAAISDPLEAAEAIALLAPMAERFGVANERLNALGNALEPWFCDVANGLATRHVYAVTAAIEAGGAESVPLCLATLISDIETLTGKMIMPYERLVSAAAIIGPSDGTMGGLSLLLDRKAARRIETLKAQGLSAFRQAVVEAGRVTGEALPMLAHWEREHPELRNLVALLRSEHVGLQAGLIRPLVELLDDTDDLTRCRAAMALYGHEMNSATTVRLSRTGPAIAEEIAELLLELANPLVDDIQRMLALRWANEFLIYDDRVAVVGWVEDMTARPKDSADNRHDIARTILSNINYASREVQLALVAGLRYADEVIQFALLASLCKLAGRNALCGEAWEMLDAAQGWIHKNVGDELRFLPSLASFAEAAVAGTEPELLSLFPDQGPPMSLQERFTTAGAMQLYGDFYKRQVIAAARSVPITKASYRALVKRLLRELAQDQAAGYHLWNRASEALIVTAALVERSPQTFYAAVGLPTRARREASDLRLEEALVHAVKHHKTFTGRGAAMMLLSQLRWLSSGVCDAIASGLRDVSYVQAITIAGVSRYRFATPAAVEKLRQKLDQAQSSALAVALHAQLLIALVRNDRLGAEFEDQMAKALVGTTRNRLHERVFALVPLGGEMGHTILSFGYLDQVLLTTLTDPEGISTLGLDWPMLGSSR